MTDRAPLLELIFGRRVAGKPPERVLHTIEQQQRQSELLIAVVQLLVILTFITLYAIAPRPNDGGMFESVTFKVIVAYASFSIIRLGLCLKGFMPAWFLTLSVIADVALLMVLIWGFHIEYGQPAGFYLKAPTLLYVFIFIALRALRFDVNFLLLTGVSAALGWLFLVYYATSMASDDPITRSYVEYMTSNKVLRGAEFDKIITIIMTTGILAVAIIRARRLLVWAITDGTAAQDLKRFFAPEIAQAITGSESQIQPGQGEVRDAAILHVDIRGFTAQAARLRPNELMHLLAEYQARMVAAIRRHGGSIDKFMGDGILASFGAAVPSKTYAADGMKTIFDVRQAVEDWNAERSASGLDPIRIGVALTAGQVIFGAVGDASRLEYTVIGDPVNLAAKLDKQCKVEECFGVVTADTLRLAEAQGYQRPAEIKIRPDRDVEGVPGKLDLAVIRP